MGEPPSSAPKNGCLGDAPEGADAELMLRAGLGDGDAFMVLYDRFAPQILGLLIRIMRNRADAEDVFQVTMLEIWRKSDAYNQELGSVRTWILMIARARGIDELRRRQLVRRDGDPNGSSRNSHTGTDESNHSGLVAGALRSLPDEQRFAIEMAFYRGLTREQAAAVLGVPVGTIKTRIRTGVQALAGILERRKGHRP